MRMKNRESLEKEILAAEKLYAPLAEELEAKHFNQIVGFHLETGTHFIGGDELQAHDVAAEGLQKPFRLVFIRIGSPFVHHIG